MRITELPNSEDEERFVVHLRHGLWIARGVSAAAVALLAVSVYLFVIGDNDNAIGFGLFLAVPMALVAMFGRFVGRIYWEDLNVCIATDHVSIGKYVGETLVVESEIVLDGPTTAAFGEQHVARIGDRGHQKMLSGSNNKLYLRTLKDAEGKHFRYNSYKGNTYFIYLNDFEFLYGNLTSAYEARVFTERLNQSFQVPLKHRDTSRSTPQDGVV